MNLSKKCTATNALRCLALLALLSNGALAYAASAGAITHLSGPLFAKKADGTVKVLAEKSEVEPGDILVTEKNTYARIKFIDNSEITLRPNTQFKIDSFAFDDSKKEKDSAIFSLIKGGLRSVTGLLGKRSRERFELTTPTATIGIRGTTFIVEYVSGEDAGADSIAAYNQASVAALDPAMAFPTYLGLVDTVRSDVPSYTGLVPLQLALTTPVPGAKSPGLYVQVLDGMIHLTNGGGSQSFTAGQFGYTASFVQPPVILPANPGMQFTPPPSFSSTSSTQNGGTSSNKAGTVDCEVR
jgi:hypothetical protein